MIEIGRLCMKLAGRDAGKTCVVVEVIDSQFVLIDGETRRRKCNISHLEPLSKTVKISKGASHEVVAKEFDKLGLKALNKKSKSSAARPRKVRKAKKKSLKEAKPKAVKKKTAKKKAEKKAEPKKIEVTA